MTAAPPVSVLLPVRDAAAFLPDCLASLSHQTMADFEVCLQDDGSSDASLELASEAAREDPRLRIASGPPGGIVAALNRAAQRARGHLWVRMDADDVSAPHRFARLVEAAATHPEVAFFGSRTRFVPRDDLSSGMRAYETWLDRVLTHDEIVANRYVECPLPHPTWALRAPLLASLGGYRDGPFPEDYDLFLRAAEAGVRFHKVDEVLLDWREGDHRASRRDARYSLAAFFETKARSVVRHARATAQDVVLVGMGRAARRWARRLERDGVRVAFFVAGGGEARPPAGADRDVRGLDALNGRDDVLVLVTAGPSTRDEARRRLASSGRAEGDGFLCVQ